MTIEDTITFEEAVNSLQLKFSSGNSIEVERATILRKEWGAILPILLKEYHEVKTKNEFIR